MFGQRGLRIETKRHVAVFVLQLFQVAGDQANQVVDVGLLLQPADGLEAGVVDVFPLSHTVAEHRHVFGNVANYLGGRTFVRIIETGKPMSSFVGLALRPDMRVCLRISHLRRAEIETLDGFSRIVNVDREFCPRR